MPLTPAVAYVRMSTDKQDGSPQQQRDEITALAQGRYRIVRWYVDEGISGANSDRREFRNMITDASELQDFQVVLCWSQDRFSRFDPAEANYYWHTLRMAGVRIETVTEGAIDLDDLGGWITASVNQHAKAQYLRDLSKNVLRARLSHARQGKWTSGSTPYGYVRTDDGQLVHGAPERVATVRWLFEQYATTDTSLADLADQLNGRGVSAPGGDDRHWTRASIRNILKREAYMGRAVQLRESKGKFGTIRAGAVDRNLGHETKPVEDWFYVECPPIVAREQYDQVQAKLASRHRVTSTKRGDGGYLLSGLLHCSHCGAHMFAAANDSKGNRDDRFYQCSTYGRRGSKHCKRNLFRESTAVEFIVDAIRDRVLLPKNFDRLAKAVEKEATRRQGRKPAELDGLKANADRLAVELKAATVRLLKVPDDLHALAVDQVREIQARHNKALAALEAAEARCGATGRSPVSVAEKALAGLHSMRAALTSGEPRKVRAALQAIIERIDLEFEHVQGPKQTRSVFRRGTLHFQACKLDSAGWPELAQLPDVGEILARRIVEVREERGPYRTQKDLLEVGGIGRVKLSRMAPHLLPLPDERAVAGQ